MRPLRRVVTAVTKPRAVEPLSRVIDYPLLISWGYDPVTGIFAPEPDHPLLGYQVCRVGGCGREAWHPEGLCSGCRCRLAAAGGDVELFSARGVARKNRSRDRRCLVCRVPGFERPVGTNDLCLACDGLRRAESPPAADRWATLDYVYTQDWACVERQTPSGFAARREPEAVDLPGVSGRCKRGEVVSSGRRWAGLGLLGSAAPRPALQG